MKQNEKILFNINVSAPISLPHNGVLKEPPKIQFKYGVRLWLLTIYFRVNKLLYVMDELHRCSITRTSTHRDRNILSAPFKVNDGIK